MEQAPSLLQNQIRERVKLFICCKINKSTNDRLCSELWKRQTQSVEGKKQGRVSQLDLILN